MAAEIAKRKHQPKLSWSRQYLRNWGMLCGTDIRTGRKRAKPYV